MLNNDLEKLREKTELKKDIADVEDSFDEASDEFADDVADLEAQRAAAEAEDLAAIEAASADPAAEPVPEFDFDAVDNILDLKPEQYPRFTLAKNKARFLRMVSDYRGKQEWLDVAPLSGVTKLFKQQTKELVGIRAKKLDYEMEIEMGTLTPVQVSHRKDELKMCKVQEKMAVSLISKMQVKIRSGRR